ncbi:flagellar biosynthesis protein FlhG [Paenibacillus cellulosilyticus]|uniref:Flagellar biosynthesis protein FlhG n=1 Tax=Paenibacillus cellulosilyticus TaxID=375489 RepID=A0A2V2YXR9_9BACL|nr:MinD/ParA family protein [Paenibacillus cellulosilyticus]PWW06414.1 flagellar biosynthesis protein FlhG [Paenibacillus cellulosilyticus]QKS46240.1 MinD/ParA family protein [Paenibacillus cellulosilyticus]
MYDQAEALRNWVRSNENVQAGRGTRIITVTSGKGGVGKSNFSLNFALTLQQYGKSVLVFDADIGMANLDVLMGHSATYSIYHLLKQDKTIWDIIQLGPQGLHFVAGGSGMNELLSLSDAQLNKFIDQLDKLQGRYDYLIFDTGAGLSKETASFIAAAHETIVVTTPEPTAITDAYALMKMVRSFGHTPSFRLVVNRALDNREGLQTAEKIAMAARKFMGIEVPLLGIIADDSSVSRAVREQRPFSLAYPTSDASRGIQSITRAYLDMPALSQSTNGGVKGFLHKMIRLMK